MTEKKQFVEDKNANHNSSVEKLNEDKLEYFKSIFNKYDVDGNGKIEFKEFKTMLQNDQEVQKKIVKKVFKISDKNDNDRLSLNEFITMVEDKRFRKLFDRYMKSYINFIVPRHKRIKFRPKGRSARSVETIALDGSHGLEQDGYDEGEGAYEEKYSCWPPPVALLVMSIIEIACFMIDEYTQPNSTKYGDGKTAKIFIYDPFKRKEGWRFLTYMFVHIGYTHLTVNLITQIVLGIPLEMVNQTWRVLAVYFSGVVAGSLVTSITDPTCFLAGASGGVYAILTAHVSNIIMNWHEMTFPGVQLFILLLLITADLGTAIHNRYFLQGDQTVGYSAHIGGALAGFLVGIWVLKNLEPSRREKFLWWGAFVLYILLIGTAILLNLFWKDHFYQV